MIRRSLREIVNGIKDDDFFIPPTRAATKVQIVQYFEKRIKENKVMDKILEGYRVQLNQKYPSLPDFLFD
jgi:hypothetical protein